MYIILVLIIVFILLYIFCFHDFFATLISLKHFFKACYWSVIDIYNYIKNKEWKKCKVYGIQFFGGLFGTGKTFNIVQYVYYLYNRYDNVEVVSNIHLTDIPYTEFRFFEQIKEPAKTSGNVVIFVIDELGSLMNSRNYKNNKITETEYIAVLNQIRKEHKLLLVSTQRYGMVDKMFRQVCETWMECKRFWRFFWYFSYDPQDLEYSLDPRTIRPLSIIPTMIFATNKHYSRYNTYELVKPFDNVIEITNRADTADNNNSVKFAPAARKKYVKR